MRFGWSLLNWLAVAAALVACGGGGEAPATTMPAATSPTVEATSIAAAAGFPFPTGPAVLVPEGYEPPGDIVDSTGAHLPANGRPTLVFVDAIW